MSEKNLTVLRARKIPFPGYDGLINRVEKTLLHGRREMEKAKILASWHAGKVIADYFDKHKKWGVHYGGRLYEKLSDDLKISERTLHEWVKLSRTYPISRLTAEFKKGNLTLTHFVKLLSVPDEKKRDKLEHLAEKNDWTVWDLKKKIQQETAKTASNGKTRKAAAQPFKLTPIRGQLNTHRIVAPDSKDVPQTPLVDVGFIMRQPLPEGSKGFKVGDIVESVRKKNGKYALKASSRRKPDLYTYQAYVVRIVDGDTLIVYIDMGLGATGCHSLRLRCIDAAEKETPEGLKAKKFVEKELHGQGRVIMASTKSDKYGRFLADIFYGKNGENYLNQKLLDEGLAVRMEE